MTEPFVTVVGAGLAGSECAFQLAALGHALAPHVGEKLYFYDAIAPIVAADSIDMTKAFAASRYGKGEGPDYLNLPLTKAEYTRLVAELKAGQKLVPHAFEEPRYFE